MQTRFRLPALLIVTPPILTAFWYYLNTDKVGSTLFGEQLHYCQVFGCSVTRERFFAVAIVMAVLFAYGIFLLVQRSNSGGKNA